jgi:membrane-bound serine protease (ClpP class)
VLALILFMVDVYATTHGVLTAGGVVAFFLGAMMLFTRASGYGLPLALVIPATVVTALFFLFVVGAGLRAQWLSVKTGRESMIGKTATVLSAVDSKGGKVFVEGEYWNAVSDMPLAVGQFAQIVDIQGLTLSVKPKT